jgi:hypothetical protein
LSISYGYTGIYLEGLMGGGEGEAAIRTVAVPTKFTPGTSQI